MKFLGKNPDSKILQEELTYKRGQTVNNKRIKELLLEEQKNFCAYTEKYLQGLDSSEVEHFDSSVKYSDDYYNYYAVTRAANQYKKDEDYIGSSFFKTLFFHDAEGLSSRIKYIKEEGVYEEVDESDQEAIDFIDFLGFNHPVLFEQRRRHIKRLKRNFKDAGYDDNDCLQYFRDYNEDLNFITAIESELRLDLSEFYL